ncbi:hypothetical protein [Tritonibacter horizontis]|uniref:Uncharacterized protein n=1 Tax=Tritonibacter horizontis TaxID=1768241 RepID=A0A132BWU0_9RHOB|nr:hypothetical protein [Tritonibacter horizontis]KUP92841.1 hypothetical protein TRIHO_22920 [Tritonibacter horizontis]
MKRKKSRFEQMFSLSRHRKRWGAAAHAAANAELSTMKTTLIDAGAPVQTRGAAKSLDAHIENLRVEFSGRPELLWHHAKLIVLIRRDFRLQETYAQFRALWDQEGDFLCANLNIRWLISATDTLADHDPDPQVRAVAMMASLLVNAVKVQESERFICDTGSAVPNPAHIERLQTDLVPLFEGMSCFTIGTDDTLRNMYWRLEPFMETPPAGAILRAIWDRFQVEDTVFARLRALHTRDKTGWWRDTPD